MPVFVLRTDYAYTWTLLSAYEGDRHVTDKLFFKTANINKDINQLWPESNPAE